jgi:hypothetical protein
MAKKHSKKDFAPQTQDGAAPRCEASGCDQPGAYKAPKTKSNLREYQWLCLDHIREYNKQWDYFKGMDSEQIESFMRDAVTGHRPTWSRESRMRTPIDRLEDALYEFMFLGERKISKPAPRLSAKLQKAVTFMEIKYPYNAKELKTRYRVLVKTYHPDVNKGDKLAEEKFKRLTSAYHILSEHIKDA